MAVVDDDLSKIESRSQQLLFPIAIYDTCRGAAVDV